jgi:hypothetical protein
MGYLKIPYLLVYSMLFYQVSVINSAGVADVCIAIAVFLSITFNTNGKDISVIFLLFFLLVIFLETYFINSYNLNSFTNGFIRIITLALGYYYIPTWIVRKQNFLEGLLNQLSIVLIIISILVIIEFILLQFNLSVNMSLYNAGSNLIDVNKGRVKIIYSEPSVVTMSIATFLTPILFYHRKINVNSKLIKYSIILSFLSLFLTSSLIGIVFLIVFFYYHFLRKSKSKLSYLILVILITVLGLIIGSSFISNAYTNRINKIVLLEDGSANRRLIGSWQYVFTSLKGRELTGIGLNQTVAFARRTNIVLDFFHSKDASVNNTFAAILLELGYIGLFSYIIFILSVFKKNYLFLLVFFLLGMAGTGYFFSITWFFFYLARIFNLNKIDLEK